MIIMGATTLVIITLILHTVLVRSGDYIPNRKCATLYSAVNFEGETFVLEDFDQSVNFKRDYRQSLKGWHKTGSLRVEMDCSLAMCTTTYILNKCRTYNGTDNGDVSSYNYLSASCTCKRECDCGKIKIPIDTYKNGYSGRAYFNQQGCNSCDNEYARIPNISPANPKNYLSDVDRRRIEVIAIPAECTLKIYRSDKPTSNEKPTIIKGPYAKLNMANKRFGYYEMSCNTSKPSTPIHENFTVNMSQIPVDRESLFNLLLTNATLRNHPALKASLKSIANRRSSKNAYVIFIGEPTLNIYGFPWCKTGNLNEIWACHIPVWIDDLRITAELRVIVLSNNGTSIIPKLTADLDEYMSSHEELRNVIPNAVIVRSNPENYGRNQPAFLRRLVAVKALKSALVDELYPNLVFILDYWKRYDLSSTPQEKVDLAETEIYKYIELPNSLYPVGLSLKTSNSSDRLVNGYIIMQKGAYWPKNMENIILNNCKNGGDPLGYAIFKSAFHDNRSPRYTIDPIYSTVSANKTKVEYYEKYFSDNLLNKNTGKSVQYNEDGTCVCQDLDAEINGIPEELFNADDPICRCKSD